VSIRDYWDDETVSEVAALLKEYAYADLFPQNLTEMKGGGLGEIRIELKPDAKPIRKRPYRMNPIRKEKVQEEINKMLVARFIFPV